MFAAGKDGELRMLPLGPAPPERRAPAHGQVSWSLTTSSTSSGACSGLDLFVELYIRTTKIVRGIPIMTSMSHPVPRKRERSLHTCAQDVQITRTTNNMVNRYNISLNYN
jgi:hypothetical protein